MQFDYKARNQNGRIEADMIEAETREAAASGLRSRGLMPITLAERRHIQFGFQNMLGSFRSVSLFERITFLRNLSVMIKAGVAVPRALQIITALTSNARFRAILSEMTGSVQGGTALSESMAKHPDQFGPLYVSLVEVGESGGSIEQNIDHLVHYLRRDYELLKKTKGALVYPAVVMGALVIVVILMFTFVLPKLTSTFEELSVELPFSTKILIAVVNAFSNYSYLIIGGLIAVVAGAKIFSKSPMGRAFFDKIYLMLPIIGKATKRLNLARFTMTLSSLMGSGMPIVDSVKVAGRSMTNMYYSEAARTAAEQVRSGVSLPDALAAYPKLFSPFMVQMLKVGEESGTIETVLDEINLFYEEELDEFIKNLSSIIEPVMVIAIGLVVGFLALALITPIYNISQNM